AISALHKGRPETHTTTTALATLHTHGHPVTWTALLGTRREHLDLPTYPFQRRPYWLSPAATPGRQHAAAAVTAENGFWEAVERADLDALDEMLEATEEERRSLAALLPALAGLRRRAGLGHRIGWQPLADTQAAPLAGRWLLLGADGDEDVAPALLRAGAQEVATGTPESLRQLVEAGPLSGVLLLAASASDNGFADETAGATAALDALDALGVPAPVWLLTRGAAAATAADAPAAPESAALWGAGPSLAARYPERAIGLLDLPTVLDPSAERRLAAALSGETGEHELALRPGGLLARRLLSVDTGRPHRRWSPTGTVLVTGADTEAGRRTVRRLATQGAHRLLLVVPPSAAVGAEGPAGLTALTAELASLGAEATVAAVDLSDRAALARVLAAVPADHPLDGVVHLAPADGEPATAGALRSAAANLDELTHGTALSAFVLVSDAAGALGLPAAPGQATLPAFHDAIAARRLALGEPALSLCCGPWAEEPGSEARTAHELGLLPLPSRSVLDLLGRSGHLVVADVDWPTVAAGQPWAGRFFHEIPAARTAFAAAPEPDGAGAGGSVLERLAGASAADRSAILLAHLRAEVATVLGLAAAEEVSPETDLMDLGMSSLTAMELVTRTKAAGIELTPALIYDQPTLADLSQALLDLLSEALTATGAAPTAGTASHTATAETQRSSR
ncbi:beta-ketoacyl reductase, partial [Kitasatospora sp. NPDC004669]|uniref:beta-ketoacyl reductase n=1 Tax=Kitasatospora sp. NPDC004669 TaxID=3154555 RepID=UPI0033BC3F55